jgi:hypothetical protein
MDFNLEYVVATIFLRDKTLEDIEFPEKWTNDRSSKCYVANDEKYFYEVKGEKGKRPIMLPYQLVKALQS